MKQTAVERLVEQILNHKGTRIISTSTFYIKDEIIEEAKEIERKQKDDYAIEFAEWCGVNYFVYNTWDKSKSIKELLEIFKKEKGL